MTNTTTTRAVIRTRTRRTATTHRPISARRDHCFYCGGFAHVMTRHGREFCPVCYGSGVM